MRIKPAVSQVVGKVTRSHWSQALVTPTGYGILEIVDQEGVARARGINLLSHLSSALVKPPTSLPHVVSLVKELKKEGVVSVGLLVPVGRVLYIALEGAGSVYLRREEQLATLLTGSGSISGSVNTGDTVLLASSGFTSTLTPEELTSSFDHLTPTEVAEKLTLLLHQKTSGGFGCALVFAVSSLLEYAGVAKDEQVDLPVQSVTGSRLTGVWKNAVRMVPKTVKKHPRRGMLIVSIALASLFLISLLLGVTKEQSQTAGSEIRSVVSEATRVYEEGVALEGLNQLKSRERLVAAKTMLEPYVQSTTDRTREGKELLELYRSVSDALTLAMQVHRVDPELYYDVALIKKDARSTHVAMYQDTLAMLDAQGSTVYSVGIPTKSGLVAGGGEALRGASAVAVHGVNVYVFAQSGIFEFRKGEASPKTSVIKKDADWGDIGALVAFAGNLYLLDTTKSRIWKYVATETGFSERREYLNPDTLPDLSLATSMAIDGTVWVGTGDGQIIRFSSGAQATFVPQGIEPELGSELSVYTSDETEHLYVLDPQNRRVVQLAKDGVYVAQYIWEEGKSPTDFVVSEKQKKIFLVIDGMIYAIEMK